MTDPGDHHGAIGVITMGGIRNEVTDSLMALVDQLVPAADRAMAFAGRSTRLHRVSDPSAIGSD